MFQYISCYSLSDIVTDALTAFGSFNTSHVILYPLPSWIIFIAVICFNTSHVILYLKEQKDEKNVLQFQYISCYSLSGKGDFVEWYDPCFNTSHVILYLNTTRRILCRNLCFNTSHVILYPDAYDYATDRTEVSIHLMLFFILTDIVESQMKEGFNTSHVILYHNALEDTITFSEFQYISCYSLSRL